MSTHWTFPDLPPFLAGLTLEHLAKLQALLLKHGKKIGRTPLGDILHLKVKDPAPMTFVMIGPPESGDFLVFDKDDQAMESHVEIRFPGTAVGGRLIWSPAVALADALRNLDPDRVVWTSQLRKSAKDGLN